MINIRNILLDGNICEDNDYFNKYIELIESNILTEKVIYVTQRHHIIPRFYYKDRNIPVDDSENNIIYLKYCDHVLAHFYLAMSANNERFRSGNLCAVRWCMRKYSLSSTEREFIEQLPEIQIFYEEAKHIKCIKDNTPEKISKSLIGRKSIQDSNGNQKYVHPDDLGMYLKAGWKLAHNKHTDITKEKLRNCQQGRIKINRNGMIKSVKPDDLEVYLQEGWKMGMGIKRVSSLKGKTSIVKDNKCKYINKEDLPQYENQGWVKGNLNKGNHNINLGKHFSDEHKYKLGSVLRGKRCVHKNNTIKYINESDIEEYLNSGWLPGSGVTHSKPSLGKVWVNNGVVCKYASKDELDSLPSDWKRGRLMNKGR